ncbi:hypothetical protein HMPREF0454_03782 [Hafnia alvei ATCC 51873]|uniref:Uncharacterized protein n=1 Tax=Hafnia alvei ATCC 51873 TaxID=1002364 RepID=G9YB19_HAFAL|nr:hypothetical protein HMPREF0454_03782 [Hafnia alvei ATCC 51873]
MRTASDFEHVGAVKTNDYIHNVENENRFHFYNIFLIRICSIKIIIYDCLRRATRWRRPCP